MLCLIIQDDAYNRIHVADVDFSILVNVGALLNVGTCATAKDDVDDGVDIGNVHFSVTVHVTVREAG